MYQSKKDFFFSSVPIKYRKWSLSNFGDEYLKFGKRWARNINSLFIYGQKGTGKTSYVFALIREIFDLNPTLWLRYFTSTDLDSRLLLASRSSRQEDEKEEIDNRSKEDILFIDDIGRETKSDRLRRQYFEIINYRYSWELPTIVTSNYTLDELSISLDSAISSRMQEWEFLEFSGNDLRKGNQTA